MFFVASKIFWFVASPLHLGLFAIAFGLWRVVRQRRGAGFIGFGLALIAAMTFLPVGAALLRPLEDRFPVQTLDMPAPDWRHRAGRRAWTSASARRAGSRNSTTPASA